LLYLFLNGLHAKLVIVSPVSVISQYESCLYNDNGAPTTTKSNL